MHRKLIPLAVLALTTLAAGCCMCDAPFDYCGPTFLAGPGEDCVCDARMNSAFTPYGPADDYEVFEEGQPPSSVLAPREAPTSPAPPPDDTDQDSPSARPITPSPPPPSAPQPSTTQTYRSRPVTFRR